jgi:vitamin K-dependent gamma-carboxylase
MAEQRAIATWKRCRLAFARAGELAARPRDPSVLLLFRVLYGLLIAVSAARFLAHGWVETFFVKPLFMFKYWGFAWVSPLGSAGMHAVFALLLVSGLAVAIGAFYRASLSVLLVLFAYIHLLDVTNYLNHYYLVLLVGALLWWMPLGDVFSVDAWRRSRNGSATPTAFPAWCTYVMRFQVSIVYFFAGMAKFTSDWLLHAEPLNIWLSSLSDYPLLGGLFARREMAFVMSWSGFLFDTFVWCFLLWRRTRPLAFAAVVMFHTLTAMLFPIGMFPFIMMSAALVFFDRLPFLPARPLSRKLEPARPLSRKLDPARAPRALSAAAFALYALVQIALPLRHLAYGTDSVLWHEQGMRFSWRVMAREKNGSVTYRVEDQGTSVDVPASRYLDDRQLREFATQPDLILQLAHHIKRDYAARGRDVRVYAEAYASWNGRPRAKLIDEQHDLGSDQDDLTAKSWIAAAPHTPPLHLRPIATSP